MIQMSQEKDWPGKDLREYENRGEKTAHFFIFIAQGQQRMPKLEKSANMNQRML